MQPLVMNGKLAAEKILTNLICLNINKMKKTRPPGLAEVQVGDNPASASYIRGKQQAAEKYGIRFSHVKLPHDISENELKNSLEMLSEDPLIDGYILQLPLDVPTHSSLSHPEKVHELLALIPPRKDADGLH